MFNPSRDQVRRFFCDAWQKDRQGLPLVGAETIAVDLIRLHPEYRYHYFENVGTPEEKYINDSKRIATIRFPYFSLLIIRTETF